MTSAPMPVRADVRPDLTNADRCDRCGAQAFIRAVLAGGTDLVFCMHHGRLYEDSLRKAAVEYVDESHRLDSPAAAGNTAGRGAGA